MTTFLTPYTERRKMPATPSEHGLIVGMDAVIDLSGGYTAAEDRIDLFRLPPGAQVVTFEVEGVSVGAVTLKAGWLAGDGSVGTHLMTAIDIDDAVGATLRRTCLGHLVSASERTISAQISGDVAAGAGKLLFAYCQYYLDKIG